MIRLAQEIRCLNVLPAPVLVGYPFPILAAIVKVKHRSYGIHPHAINVVLVEPEQGVGNQEVADFVAVVVEHQRTPLFMFSFTRVRMLVEWGAIKERQTVAIFGEVTGHPVHNHPNPVLVALVNEIHQVFWRPETGGAGIVACDLIPPRAIKWMLCDGQQLNMSESQFLHLRDQLMCQFPVGEETRSWSKFRNDYYWLSLPMR